MVCSKHASRCNLGSTWAFVLQFFLGVVAFCSLIAKRYTEQPRRPWKIWVMDTTKQASAAILVHFMNLGLSMFLGGGDDQCSWYFTNVLIDTTLGLCVVFWLLKLTAWVAKTRDIAWLASGSYGNPPNWRPWLAQLAVYNVIVVIQKLLMLLVLLLNFMQSLGGSILCFINEISPSLELAIALFIFPLAINVVWFWVVDNLLMKYEGGVAGSQQQTGSVTFKKRRKPKSGSFVEDGDAGLDRLISDSSDDEFDLMMEGESPVPDRVRGAELIASNRANPNSLSVSQRR